MIFILKKKYIQDVYMYENKECNNDILFGKKLWF